MDFSESRDYAPLSIVVVGLALFLLAVVHHGSEVQAVSGSVGPFFAFALDAGLALCLVYAGYWLSRTDLGPEHRWTVAVWCAAGLVSFVAALVLTMAIRVIEGRTLAEPAFTLLVTASTGGIAGFLAGYYRARALVDTQRAQQATDALAFVNDVIRHDLRNDIQVIRTHASLLTDTDDEAVVDRAETIAEKTEVATNRIQDTGKIVKTMTGDVDTQSIDLVEVVRAETENLEATYDVTVRTDVPDSDPVRANEALQSVVANLLENAVEHNDSDDPRVEVGVERGAEWVRLVVADNGPGLPDTGVGDSVAEVNDSPGGLQIVQTLVDEFGGSVRLTDNGPDGAEFTVRLPPASSPPTEGQHN